MTVILSVSSSKIETFEFIVNCVINKIDLSKLIQLLVLLHHKLALLPQNMD